MVPNSPMRERLMNVCEKSDEESAQVLARIINIEDLSSVGAKYHLDCSKRFFREREYEKKTKPDGESKFSAQFKKLFEFLKSNEDCQWSFENLQQVMGNPLPSN